MTVRYTTIHRHHAGFGMFQAGPEWTTFGTEYGEFERDAPEVAGATLEDFLEWLGERGVVERGTAKCDEYDGNTYDQRGEIVIVYPDKGDASFAVYCAYEEEM